MSREPRDLIQHGASCSPFPLTYEHSLSVSYQGHFVALPPESPHQMGLAHLPKANSNPQAHGVGFTPTPTPEQDPQPRAIALPQQPELAQAANKLYQRW